MRKGPEAEGAWRERSRSGSGAEETGWRRKQMPDQADLVVPG